MSIVAFINYLCYFLYGGVCMKIINGTVFYKNSRFEKRDICISDGIICDSAEGEVFDASGCYVIPGLIDVHIHGCINADASSGDIEAFEKMSSFLAKKGVTSFCPATMTLPIDTLEKAFKSADLYKRTQKSGSRLIGINMEGPYFSMAKKGAQNPDYIKNPDADEFERLWDLSHGIVAIADVAPELPGALDYISKVSKLCAVSIAHTSADYSQTKAGLSAGAVSFTHLFNAMTPLNHREPGCIGAAFESDSCFTELICDCIHVHPAVIKTVFKAMGEDRVCAISDALPCAGLPEGKYLSGGLEVTLANGCARLEDGTLAGSASTLFDNFKKLANTVSLESAIKACTSNPARLTGIYEKTGSVETGKNADIIILDKDFNLKAVYIGGKKEL